MKIRSALKFASVVIVAAVASYIGSARADGAYSLIDPSTLSAVANTTSGNGGGSRKAEYAVNGAGMNDDGETHKSDAANNQMWEPGNVTTDSPASFKVDLGRVVLLNGIKMWNYNWSGYTSRGAKAIEIYYTDDETKATLPSESPISYIRSNWTALTTDYQLPQASGSSTYAGDDMITFSSVSARWVVLVITSNWGGGNGGLSEVRFYENKVKPEIGEVTLARNSATEYSLEAVESVNDADLYYILSDGITVSTNEAKSVVAGGTASWSISDLSADTTYQISVFATNDYGCAEVVAGTLYTGALVLTKDSDGSETGLVPATLTVSRTSTGAFDLVVNYAFTDGTAVAGKNYVDDDGCVTIAAGETSATITVTPLVDATTDDATTMTVSIADGNYTAPASGVEVSIANFTTPAGYNYWVASADSDGLASNASNWSQGHSPLASETVVWDGGFSQKDMEWDASSGALTDTVAGWVQTNSVGGTVTFYTTYPSQGTFSTFTVTGDVCLESGSWTHPISRKFNSSDIAYSSKCATGGVYRLNVAVGGDMTIAKDGLITVCGKGAYPETTGCTGGSSYYGTHGGTHSGSIASFGSVFRPTSIGGVGTQKGTDQFSKYAAGSGFVHISVVGDLTLEGTINASSYVGYAGAGGGGSVWLEIGGAFGGSGSVKANGASVSDGQGSGGGRVAVYADTIAATLTITASAPYNRGGGAGAGTVYLQDSSVGDGQGLVVIDAGRSAAVNGSQITPIVPQYMEGGDSFADFRNASIKVSGGARAWATNVMVKAVAVPANISKIDLRGCKFKTEKLTLAGHIMPIGTYGTNSVVRATDGTSVTLSDYLVDTTAGGDGVLIVAGSGMVIRLR